MKKLFSGRFHKIPMAVLAGVLILLLSAGAVFAVVEAYELWSGSATVEVIEPVSLRWGYANGACPYTLDGLADNYDLYAGSHKDTWFKISSLSPDDLLIKATTDTDDAMVTITFYDDTGSVVSDITTSGLLINSATGPIYVMREISVSGSAPESATYSVSTAFTRESPP